MDEYKHHLENCQKTAKDLNDLVKRLSALSRIGGREEPPHIAPIPVHAILTSCISTFKSAAQNASVIIAFPINNDSFIAQADSVLLQLIFNNLLDNAISYATAGTTISIEIKRTQNRIEISFTNECEDLPNDLERLFEPLFRRDASRTETGNSHLGIGLTLSREAASAMGGRLTAALTAKDCVCFTLSLPQSD